ncbi:MAG: hypothetical protein QM730_05380 [Anaerolineales bacterium]
MKKAFLFLSLFIVLSLACTLSVDVAPTISATQAPTQIVEPPTTTPEIFISLTQAMPATEIPTIAQSVEVSVPPLTVSLPTTLATGARGAQIPRADGQDLPYFELTPGHTELELEGYILQGKFHTPKIYVFPAMPYVELVPAAFESMHRLRNVMNPGATITPDQLPGVPFFNAAQVFASNVQPITFQNGDGVRFLTEYAQYAAPVNNHELFYHFQGFSSDGEYYIIAILPVTAPVLAETSEAGAAIPAGGIVLPDINDPNADWQGYYSAVTDLLNNTSPESFTPTLSQLDALIQSMNVNP